MTASGSVLLATAALVAGIAVGFFFFRTRGRDVPEPAGPTAAELLLRSMRSSDTGVVMLNRFGDLVLYNARAEELGLLRGNQVDGRVRDAAQRVVDTDTSFEVDISPEEVRGRQPEAVVANLRPLGDGFTVVEAVDQSDAVRLEATRRDFVANVSHELKTPVGAIALLAEAVLDADSAEEARRFSEKILRESNRLGKLVTELIALSRLQGAEKLPEMTIVDVDGVVAETLSRTKLAAETSDITVTTDGPSGLEVEGDRTLLVTALSNLLDNAIAYSQESSPVSISRRLTDGHVELAVTDRGLGIALDEQQRVFERFYRADRARSRATGGTGLGLAIVKHVAANHGGEVRLWSRPGVGSTFTLRIPARTRPADADSAAATASDTAASDSAAGDSEAGDGPAATTAPTSETPDQRSDDPTGQQLVTSVRQRTEPGGTTQ
ncbi:two-component system sensor histidine kinase SenX3 [Prauserella isguenensis]|uniref:Sensor-like histidine kinase SenX3 n=1 Tax=Prauserella isguenensis TaxID=1470180 RepID=A0A839RW60_9PSEU|nr:two-component system sensor histidine kinase SenX3 [Prauserella isguenensis]